MIRLLFLPPLFVVLAVGQQPLSLSLAANGQKTLTQYRGSPLLLEAAAFVVSGEQGVLEWPAPLRLIIRDAAGESQEWPLVSLGATTGPVVLQLGQSASKVWGLSGDATSALREGTYVLWVEHPAANTGTSVVLTLVNSPDSFTADERILKSELESKFAQLKGDLDGALAVLDASLLGAPTDIGLLSQRTDVLQAMGRINEAVTSSANALNEFVKQNPDAPTGSLSRRLRELLNVSALTALKQKSSR